MSRALPLASSRAQITRAQDIFIMTRAWLPLDISPLKLASPTRLESEPRFANTWSRQLLLLPNWSAIKSSDKAKKMPIKSTNHYRWSIFKEKHENKL